MKIHEFTNSGDFFLAEHLIFYEKIENMSFWNSFNALVAKKQKWKAKERKFRKSQEISYFSLTFNNRIP